MLDTVQSKNGISIRLTDERWSHITEEHCELAGMRLAALETIANPGRILEGGDGELLAIRETEKGKFLVVELVLLFCMQVNVNCYPGWRF